MRDPESMRRNIQEAATDDLLDRATAYRADMDAEAIELIEQELHKRGVTAAQIAEHREAVERECVLDANGSAKMCMVCRKPAVREVWGWHKIMNTIPIFARARKRHAV